MNHVVTTHGVQETIALGRRLGERLRAGDVVALSGQLGAGKTHLTKGIALGLGVATDRSVNSPTFVIVNEYVGRSPIRHIDAYRLGGAPELAALGFEEMVRDGAVIIIEWPERVRDALPPKATWIEIEVLDEFVRRFTLRAMNDEVCERVIAPMQRP